MQEHPVPQNVTGYEFHLIGQMTLKQFVESAVGVGIAVLINLTNLPDIFKIPAMAIAGLGGFALAFIPLEGRSLDRWFFAFIKSIYQPTLFFWKKTNPIPDFFTYIQPKNIDTSITVDYAPLRSNRVREFLRTIDQTSLLTNPGGVEEEPDTEAILKLFLESSENSNLRPKQDPTIFPQVKVNPVVLPEQKKEPITVEAQPPIISSPTPTISTESVSVFQAITSKPKEQSSEDLKRTSTSSTLPFPKPPTQPNMIVGMVLGNEDKILDNAIVEIMRQSDNTPMRAIKTNALGQFAIVTPLESGTYEIFVEKDGYSFDKTGLTLNNEVIQPLLIQGRSI